MIYSKIIFLSFILITLFIFTHKKIIENYSQNKGAAAHIALITRCAKDPTCFDNDYDCKSCCKNGIAKNGENCWKNGYTIDRCCHTSDSSPPPNSNIYLSNIPDRLDYDPLEYDTLDYKRDPLDYDPLEYDTLDYKHDPLDYDPLANPIL